MEMLELNNLHKTFNPGTVNEKVALNGVSLHMEAGDFATIVGSNGAGKSTMFNAITGGFIADELVTPKLLLLDEHTAALDQPCYGGKGAGATKSIVAEKKDYFRLMVTHNMHQALELGNRTLMDGAASSSMSGGRGAPQDDRGRPLGKIPRERG